MSDESKPWQRADVDVTDDLVRALLSAQAPGVGEPVFLHEGWDSRAFLVGGTWIFRFPKRAACAERLRCEIALLPRLAPLLLPVAIPGFEHIGHPALGYPYPFVGYRKLPGEPIVFRSDEAPLQAGAIAAQVGRLCGALHAFPRQEAATAGIVARDWYADLSALAANAAERLRSVAAQVPTVAQEHLNMVLTDVPAGYGGPPVLCHADLAPEHLLVDEAGERLLGLIDFGDLLLGDPAVDLVGAHLLGGSLAVKEALAHYRHPTDPGLPARTRLLAACRIADDLAYGLQDQRPVYLRAAFRALRSL